MPAGQLWPRQPLGWCPQHLLRKLQNVRIRLAIGGQTMSNQKLTFSNQLMRCRRVEIECLFIGGFHKLETVSIY